jgi:SpoVK/Ycf46/Vps4 family AAA+-type ATPase
MDNDIHDINNQLNLLTANVNYLSSYPVYYYNKLFEDNKQLNEEMESLKESNSNLRKRNFEQLDIIQQLENDLHGSNCSEDSVNNKNANKYEIKKYKKIKSSYDDDQINRLLRGIRNLKDIINLKSKWKYIKHNEILQCLYNIIPAVEKLNNMVGLENVKQIIFKKIVYFIRNRNNEEYLHTVISGPPGVGKTELAKIYADIFVRLGILKNNTFIEVKRDDLVGKYLGQTAPKTRKLIESAMGGVIFIDEAYSLGNSEKRDSFSKEAIDMINQYLSERKNEFMLIVAGYEKDLEECFFAYNSGLKRRFSSNFTIKDYDSKELKEIFIRKLNSSKYSNQIEDKVLDSFFEKNHKEFEYFGGDVEKVISEIKYSQSFRTFNENIDNDEIIFKDLEDAFENFKDTKKKKKKDEPPFGMYF